MRSVAPCCAAARPLIAFFSQSKLSIGELGGLHRKVYVMLWVRAAGDAEGELPRDEFRTIGQPRGACPQFREDFLFEDLGVCSVTLRVS